MPQSEAQRKATNEYRKRNVRAFNLKFFPADRELLEWFESQPNKAQFDYQSECHCSKTERLP